ncbi:sugar transferase [Citricoccus alkalitolerans]|uniref:Sugar transferase n=1 Tax=Citricoccus alkalitolerans TaxID=246603 RepID=A0ABV8XVX7_9MICC
MDIVGSAGILLLSSPIIATTAVLVRKNLGSPVLFTQDRPGRHGEVFKLYKFRSMKDIDFELGLISDEDRLTNFGRLLRSTSLDELPSLMNVLKGDMSFVGPRPLLVSYLERYSSEQARRHEVRPGITGLAQVNGRNLVAWEERFEMDVKYIDSMSIRSDLQIILKTFFAVFVRSGISAEGHATMAEFRGTSRPVTPSEVITVRDGATA